MATNNSWTRPRSASNGRHPASAVNFRYSVSRSRTRHQHCYSTHLSYSPRSCNYLMPGIEIKLPPVPAGLKSVSSFISRAQELKGKDPVIAYYCLYHAVNVGMEPKNKDKEMTAFLVKLMDTLEQMKDQLKDRKEINSSEAAATYIENFALKVFHNADNEDRKGGSNRSTAKKFLAASNFFELLTLFDKKYLNAAADIAKAFREGRVPLAGPALTLDGSEDDLMNERMTSSFSEHEDPSLGSSMGAPSTHIAQSSATKTSDEPARHSPENDTSSKPTLPKMDSSSSTHTVTHPKTSVVAPIPKHISTSAPPTTPPYVIDLSPNSTLSLGPKTPLKTPGISDGSWSTAATPGIESPNPMSPYSSFSSATGAKVALNLLNSGAAARLNATSNSGKGDSPLSPGLSPKPKSSLGAAVFTASDLEANAESDPKTSQQEEGGDTDDEWSIAGNDPFSRQNSMMPAASFHHAPGVTITSTLDMVKEDGK
ncbi:DUF605-domain-containing protein [Serendipita vermifera]|nr:DUF605-domain-containing protein [Serendipita vermifera]